MSVKPIRNVGKADSRLVVEAVQKTSAMPHNRAALFTLTIANAETGGAENVVGETHCE